MPQYNECFTTPLLWLNDNTYKKRKKSFHKWDPVKCPTILGWYITKQLVCRANYFSHLSSSWTISPVEHFRKKKNLLNNPSLNQRVMAWPLVSCTSGGDINWLFFSFFTLDFRSCLDLITVCYESKINLWGILIWSLTGEHKVCPPESDHYTPFNSRRVLHIDSNVSASFDTQTILLGWCQEWNKEAVLSHVENTTGEQHC